MFFSLFFKLKDGFVVIEFGIVVILFFMFLMGIMEMLILFFGGVVLENGMVEVVC